MAWGDKRLPSAIRPVVLGRRRRRALVRAGGRARTDLRAEARHCPARSTGRASLDWGRLAPASPVQGARGRPTDATRPSPGRATHLPASHRALPRTSAASSGASTRPSRGRGAIEASGRGVTGATAPRAQRAEWHWGQRRWAVAQCEQGRCQMTSVWHRELRIVMRRLSPAPTSCAGSGRNPWPATLPRDPVADNLDTRRVHGSP